MSAAWRTRKTRLNELLGAGENEESRGLALDRILHGQSVIGRTSKTAEIDRLKFGDKDLNVLGTLEFGQYGVIDIVSCKMDAKVYVRKSVEKKFAIRTHDQCSPQFERDILLRAAITKSQWAPHLLCAFQTDTHLNLVMQYAEGGTLWDVLESSPLDGRVSEDDLRWWIPQLVSAIDWCHSQDFVHRDIKPHNFVLDAHGRVFLIDFGSAAPLLSKNFDGSQSVPKKYSLVPCGTCDYISPEILQCHEEALVALEMADSASETPCSGDYEPGGYGRETDWWSLGAMLYEMTYGVAPFFARDIRQTYLKIMDHSRSLRFQSSIQISPELQDFIRRLLTTAELRLGRQSISEIHSHSLLDGVNWNSLRDARKPELLHLPQYTYTTPLSAPADLSQQQDSTSAPFAFSALFQSSTSSPPAFSLLQQTPSHNSNKSILREHAASSFIGFSWGPTIDAFVDDSEGSPVRQTLATPRVAKYAFTPLSAKIASAQVTPQRYSFMTPIRSNTMTSFQTLPRTGTVRRTAQKRVVSDREAMKQLVNCVGMSARKKVLESGRKPRILTSASGSRASTLKELRFDRSVMVFNGDSGGVSYRMDPTTTTTSSDSAGAGSFSLMSASILSGSAPASLDQDRYGIPSDNDSSIESDFMYSPSPSPRPGSAMSGALSRGLQTPTISGSIGSQVFKGGRDATPSADSRGVVSPKLSPRTRMPGAPGGPSTSTDGPHDATLSSRALDELDRRHARLMKDIAGISERLSEVAFRISRN